MAVKKTGRGRPQNWHTKVTAPAEALEFYAMLAKLQRSEAFATCHVFHGARLDGAPIIKWNSKVHRLPFVISSFMGLDARKQQCDTPGCCNPFHWLAPETTDTLFVQRAEAGPEGGPPPDLEDWIDLVDYELDKRAKRLSSVSFEEIREWIPAEDLSNEQLRTAIQHMGETK